MVQNRSLILVVLIGLISNGSQVVWAQTGFTQNQSTRSTIAISARLSDLPANGIAVEKSWSRNQEPDQVNRSETASRNTNQEKSLADSLPVSNLRGGIQAGSLQRAIAKREIADPNEAFLVTASSAEFSYTFDTPLVWKTWESPNIRYRPLYFEDENLERYGIHVGHHLQPYKSGLHFASRVVTMPYQLAAHGWRDCEYGLGYYRPGNCTPAYRQSIPHSKRGLVVQALTIGAILGL